MKKNMVLTENELLSKTKVIASAMSIPGFLTKKEANYLFDLGISSDDWIVELGSWQGRSTFILCYASIISKSKFACVDAFIKPIGVKYLQSSPELLLRNLGKYEVKPDMFFPINTVEAAKEFQSPIDLLFIDADHSEASVFNDAMVWGNKVKVGGKIAFHDYEHPKWPGVKKAVDKWQSLNNSIFKDRYERIIVFEKTKKD